MPLISVCLCACFYSIAAFDVFGSGQFPSFRSGVLIHTNTIICIWIR